MLASCIDKSVMRERLDYVSQCNRADTVFTEAWLPTVDSLVRFFDRHGNANERMMVHYLQGRVYHDIGDAPQALACYRDATSVADTNSKDCDFKTLSRVYGQMGTLFLSQRIPKKGKEAFLMARENALRDKDTLSSLIFFSRVSNIYHMQNLLDSALWICLYTDKELKKLGYHEIAASYILTAYDIYIRRGDLKKAKKCLNEYEQYSGYVDKHGNVKKGLEGYYYFKGKYNEELDRLDSAIFFYRKLLYYCKENKDLLEYSFSGLLSVYSKKGLADSVRKYAILFAEANDSSTIRHSSEEIVRMQALYNYNEKEKLATQKEKEASDLRHFIIFMVLSVMAILSFLAYLFYRYREKLFTQLNRLKDRKDALEEMVRKKEREIKLALEHRESDIDKNIREKQAAIDSVNKELEELKQQIATLQSKAERFQHDRLEDDFYSIGFIEEFEARFKEYGKDYNPPTTREWLRLEKVFSIHFPTYYQKITSKDEITKEHVRICMLIRMDFKERMMAVALKTDSKRIDRAKRQANRILFNEDNASTLKSHLKLFFQ